MGEGNRLTSLIRSDSGIVINWLLKVSLILVLVGVVLFEVIGVVLVKATAADTAAKAAQEAGFTYRNSGSIDKAEETAKEMVEAEGAELVDYSVDDQKHISTVTVRKKAKTLFIHNIDALKKYTIAVQTQSAPLPG